MDKILAKTINGYQKQDRYFMEVLKHACKKDFDKLHVGKINFDDYLQGTLSYLKSGVTCTANGDDFEYVKENIAENAIILKNDIKLNYARLAHVLMSSCYDIAKENGDISATIYIDLYVSESFNFALLDLIVLHNHIMKNKNVIYCEIVTDTRIDMVFKNLA